MIIAKNSNTNVTVALVKVKEMTKTDKAVTLTVTETSYDKDAGDNVDRELKVAFFNSDKVAIADRLRKLDLEKDTPIVLFIYDIDGKCYGNDFLLRGKRSFTYTGNNGDVELNVFLGNMIKAKKLTKDGESFGVRVTYANQKSKDKDDIEWNNILFTDTYHKNLVARAEKCFFDKDGTPYKATYACVVTGSDKPRTLEDGTEIKNQYYGSTFELCYNPKKSA